VELTRLWYICELLRRTRPSGSVQGIGLLVAWETLADEHLATAAAQRFAAALGGASVILRSRPPVHVIAADCQRAPGFREFADSLGGPESRPWLGSRVRRLGTDTDPKALRPLAAETTDVLIDGVTPLAYDAMCRNGTAPDALEINRQVIRFLAGLSRRRAPLTEFLARLAASSESDVAPMLRSVSLATTGAADGEQHLFAAALSRFAEGRDGMNAGSRRNSRWPVWFFAAVSLVTLGCLLGLILAR
jgi:type VI protein secretion system component VasK